MLVSPCLPSLVERKTKEPFQCYCQWKIVDGDWTSRAIQARPTQNNNNELLHYDCERSSLYAWVDSRTVEFTMVNDNERTVQDMGGERFPKLSWWILANTKKIQNGALECVTHLPKLNSNSRFSARAQSCQPNKGICHIILTTSTSTWNRLVLKNKCTQRKLASLYHHGGKDCRVTMAKAAAHRTGNKIPFLAVEARSSRIQLTTTKCKEQRPFWPFHVTIIVSWAYDEWWHSVTPLCRWKSPHHNVASTHGHEIWL